MTRTYFRTASSPARRRSPTMPILGYVLGRGQGTTGLLLQTLINGINIVLSIFLGLYLGWGVMGVALATVTGEVVGAIVGFAVVYARRFDRQRAPGWATIFDPPSG